MLELPEEPVQHVVERYLLGIGKDRQQLRFTAPRNRIDLLEQPLAGIGQ